MTRSNWLVLAALAAGLALVAGNALAAEGAAAAPGKKINLLVITGGHGYDKPNFLKLFEGHDDIAYTHVDLKVGGEIFDDISNWQYDAIVLYNFNQKITDKQQENFLRLLDRGVGLLVLHHANGAYNNWPEFWNIAGVTYHFGAWEQDGKKMPGSGYKGGVKFTIHVEDPAHPITKGLTDYEITDETYCRTTIHSDVHPLLTTEEPSSDKCVGWVKTYRKAKVCYLQSGHDNAAYTNPNFRTTLVRAIRWVGRRGDPTTRVPAAFAPAPRMILAAPMAAAENPAPKKLNVAIVTGGHDFDEKPFLALFEGHEDITATHLPQKDDSELLEDVAKFPYDVIVFYNMGQKISEKRQKNLVSLLDRGVGAVVLHHALAAYQDWPEWETIVGGRFFLKPTEVNGVKHATSTYKHGVDFKVHIEDPKHPITEGVADFATHDETYKGYSVSPKAHVILSTDEPSSEKAIGWTGTYGKARTCYIELGHDTKAFTKEYGTLVARAIRWAGRRGDRTAPR